MGQYRGFYIKFFSFLQREILFSLLNIKGKLEKVYKQKILKSLRIHLGNFGHFNKNNKCIMKYFSEIFFRNKDKN